VLLSGIVHTGGINKESTMSTARDVKEAFVLGNTMKCEWKDFELFKTKLSEEKQRIAALSDLDLDALIEDKRRLRAYKTASLWTNEEISLIDCRVWPGMGSRPYLRGSVDEAASLFQRHGPFDDRLHAMTIMAKENLFSEMPLILFRRKNMPQKYRIDDGCNRAVALWLANIPLTRAYIGTVRQDLNHSW